MYAIQNRRTKKYMTGTDFRMTPHRQFTSHDEAKTYGRLISAARDFQSRQCGVEYRIVSVSLSVMEVVRDERLTEENLWKEFREGA